MYAMKKLAALFAIVLLFGLSSCALVEIAAQAVSTPYAVIGDDVWMLAESGEKLFLLPKTYYARIDKMDETYYYVTFNGVSGKVPKTSVSVVGYDKAVKDTQTIIRVAPEYSVFTEIKLKTSLESGESETLTAPTGEALTYAGTYKQGETVWYYVSYAGNYGYIQNIYTDTPEMSFAEFLPEKDEEKPKEEEEEKKEEQPELVKVLVISGVCAAVLILIIILFLPRKNKKHKYYYS